GWEELAEWWGRERFYPEKARKKAPPGVAAGLAVTEVGGDVLYVESTVIPDGRGLTLTGQLGDVMQESVRAAQSWVMAHAEGLDLDARKLQKSGVHVHVPAGAVPQDRA